MWTLPCPQPSSLSVSPVSIISIFMSICTSCLVTHKWEHVGFSFLFLLLLAEDNGFQRYPCSCKGHDIFSFFLFFWWTTFLSLNCILGFRVHVQIMQDSCVGTHMAVCFLLVSVLNKLICIIFIFKRGKNLRENKQRVQKWHMGLRK